MTIQTQVQIYLADQRGRTQSADYRSFHTFAFEAYQPESRQPFGTLQGLHDDTLLAGKSHTLTVTEPTEVTLIPVVGGIELVYGLSETVFLGAGDALRFTAYPEQAYFIVNPFETETVNFLQIWQKPVQKDSKLFQRTSFDLNNRNQLLPVLADQNRLEHPVLIGKYGGRQEGIYSPCRIEKQVFVFVIEGAFEVQNRLLHPRDGLALRPVDELEFEALSNDAILLVMEV
ncbi:hypothetical protein ACO2Q8_28305 [Larkinella sp. VNQ87]|uniref:pirin family protein n=1 Tax=Larkinella sp. VNQ87 TaxID=3400921 RepID=UPI003BFE02C6